MNIDAQILKLDNNFIAYKEHKSKKKDLPTIVFLHGLMSDMEGKKAIFLHKYCTKKDLNFIRFDNFGHGKSSGKFTEQTIGSWYKGLEYVLDNLVKGDFILVGSSAGGWVALLLADKYKSRLKGLMLLAPAADFTEESIWNKLTQLEKNSIKQSGLIEFGPTECKYPISYNLIIEARDHLIFSGKYLEFFCPVFIIHGRLDADVPFVTSLKLVEILDAPDVTLKLLQNSGHSLSSDEELGVVSKALAGLMVRISK